MKKQLTTFLALIGISAVFVSAGTVRAAASARLELGNSQSIGVMATSVSQEPSWVDQLLSLLEGIYTLLGGNPSSIDRSATANTQVQYLVDYIGSHGLPTGLTAEQRSEMIDDIEILYNASFVDASELSLDTRLALRACMLQLWMKLVVTIPTF